jgi:hypothetical protein
MPQQDYRDGNCVAPDVSTAHEMTDGNATQDAESGMY